MPCVAFAQPRAAAWTPGHDDAVLDAACADNAPRLDREPTAALELLDAVIRPMRDAMTMHIPPGAQVPEEALARPVRGRLP